MGRYIGAFMWDAARFVPSRWRDIHGFYIYDEKIRLWRKDDASFMLNAVLNILQEHVKMLIKHLENEKAGVGQGDQAASDGAGQSVVQGDQSDGAGQSVVQGDQSDGAGQRVVQGDQSDGAGQSVVQGDQAASDGAGQSSVAQNTEQALERVDKLIAAAKGVLKSTPTLRYRKDILEDARESLRDSEYFDRTRPVAGVWQFAQGNYDMATGEYRECEAKDVCFSSCGHDYVAVETAAPWSPQGERESVPAVDEFLEFLETIMGDTNPFVDTTMCGYMLRWIVYAMTGAFTARKMWFWTGSDAGKGSSGKSTLVAILIAIFGCFGVQGNEHIIIDAGRPATAGSASPHLAQLDNKRFVYINETKKKDKLDDRTFKTLCDDAVLNCRQLYKEQGTIRICSAIAVLTNHLPRLPDDDEAVNDRIIAVPFRMRFVEPGDVKPGSRFQRACDSGIKDRLSRNAPQIASFLVRFATWWKSQGDSREWKHLVVGDSVPEEVTRFTRSYLLRDDTAMSFVELGCSPPPASTGKRKRTVDINGIVQTDEEEDHFHATSEITKAYTSYCRTIDYEPVQGAEFAKRLAELLPGKGISDARRKNIRGYLLRLDREALGIDIL
eukprot:TRINITY_DN13836_c0_g2_i1.p1 TRINITY_DN13836_c0_g2~~TRINITY_DN13836_c0_g2_i1.p1  ORF type:complete len:610 (-),score=103.28 TRINITY_DN13836_c0_g2_i1:113-1942(-)